ncbi:16S rRNA (cytidine(1402)-2'-O)-methyltransferase [Candidatus Endobugula sertula]|uniref:Ribosomal RNA small subunit methyltransferase I n=1 Tax=Candidatus Endobugula sertula TaxID=62101 RepID=A0A1D2QTL3_9GAMM|nr:16S rRNA (cytidine(1402)-2'-O)-methyltransferase [Candidatus Endobugula sertula]
MTDCTFGTLYVVATPIGNLNDMVPRAVDVLQMVDIIAAEDTRHSAKLLQYFGVSTKVIAYHDYSNEQCLQKILNILYQGQSVALISDAGTPLISDPGYKLVSMSRQSGVAVVPIPGACALIAALSVSGLPSNQFIFEGFLPAKTSARIQALKKLKRELRTIVLYESPHRLLDSLADIQRILGDGRHIVIARELTKTYETLLTGKIKDVIDTIKADDNQRRGEFVLLLKGWEFDDSDQVISSETERLMGILLEELPVTQAASIAAKFTSLKKRDLYQWALDRQSDS